MTSSRPVIIICETGLRWTAAWRRCDAQAKVHVETLNSLTACKVRLVNAPASFVVVEAIAANIPELLDWLTLTLIERRDFSVAVVGDKEINDWRYELMERSAVLVATSERQLSALCAAARRHVSRWRPHELTVREGILESLPWSDTSP